MAVSKKIREQIFNKYGGRCAYCGCELTKGWHVDEIEPVRRNRVWDKNKTKFIPHPTKPYEHPERLVIENQNPACASCNINKHSDSLENFRASIKKYVESLNLYSTQYKIAKRYGLITETGAKVKFYFETLNSDQNAQECDATGLNQGTETMEHKNIS